MALSAFGEVVRGCSRGLKLILAASGAPMVSSNRLDFSPSVLLLTMMILAQLSMAKLVERCTYRAEGCRTTLTFGLGGRRDGERDSARNKGMD